MNSNSEKLRQTYNELLEFKIVLHKVRVFIFRSQIYLSLQTTCKVLDGLISYIVQ